MQKIFLILWALLSLNALAKCPIPKGAIDADIIIVGENHGNKKHVLYAACILQKLKNQYPTALALEMINQKNTPQLTHWIEFYENADQLAIDIQWWKSGWPSWNIYRPLLTKAYELKLPLIATDKLKILTETELKKVWHKNFTVVYQAWGDIIGIYHEGNIQADKLDELVRLQMSRDIHMAKAIRNYKRIHPNQKILFYTGQDHARNKGSITKLLKPYKIFTIAQNCPKLFHQFNFHTPKCMKNGE